jgi:hypothetical protein
MRKYLVTLAAMVAVLTAVLPLRSDAAPAQSPAGLVQAIDQGGLLQPVAQGCGPGFYRGPYGHCRPMGGGGVVVAPGLAVGPVVVAPACVRRCNAFRCWNVCR